jgi:lysophospholipase L1-like esterase
MFRRRSDRQRLLPFARRHRRLDRLFRAFILAITLLVLAMMFAGTAPGRLAMAETEAAVRRFATWSFGAPPSLSDMEDARDLRRQREIGRVRSRLAKAIRDGGPKFDRFFRLAAMSPETAVIRWGNLHSTLVLSSKVFAPDDSGRSYRLLPRTRSVWLVGLTINGALAMFEVPDDPRTIKAGQAAGGRLVPESVQLTNSWGCRGPEPDLAADIRILVLGDSMMQGLLVGDDETPAECLRRELSENLDCRVSVLNAGVLGYSLEQYYFTLQEFFPCLRPNIVVIGICENDLGNPDSSADRAEMAHWLSKIAQFCRTREVMYLFVPAPRELDLLGHRNVARYPGPITAELSVGGAHYFDPTEAFSNAELTEVNKRMAEGTRQGWSPLFNGRLGDHHFSPLGCSVWGSAVARRLSLLWKHEGLSRAALRR